MKSTKYLYCELDTLPLDYQPMSLKFWTKVPPGARVSETLAPALLEIHPESSRLEATSCTFCKKAMRPAEGDWWVVFARQRQEDPYQVVKIAHASCMAIESLLGKI